jgi:hypothetical protein
MAIDNAEWHYSGDFPKNLPDENGGTHIGIYLTWILMNRLEGSEILEDNKKACEKVRARKMTGRDFLFEYLDGKLSEYDLNPEARAFTLKYYDPNDSEYCDDYLKALKISMKQFYEVKDTWSNYDKVAKLMDKSFAMWKATQPKIKSEIEKTKPLKPLKPYVADKTKAKEMAYWDIDKFIEPYQEYASDVIPMLEGMYDALFRFFQENEFLKKSVVNSSGKLTTRRLYKKDFTSTGLRFASYCLDDYLRSDMSRNPKKSSKLLDKLLNRFRAKRKK